MYCKIHVAGAKTVLAACDAELIGKTLKFGEIDFHISEDFYKGKRVSKEELSKLLDEHNNINLVGKKVVSVALKKGLISERTIIKIEDIPHAQIYRLI